MKPGAKAALAVVTALLLSACGGGSDDASTEQFTGVPLKAQDRGAVHVHGLGYDVTEKTLYIATHTGMFELPPQATKPRRIGDSYQDTMGFTLVTPRLFLGSGHPDARDDRPPRLGLIKSTDRGLTWTSVSLLGEADFHLLRAQGDTVYGFDSMTEQLFVSVDAGRTWTRRRPPETLLDLAIDPDDPRHLLASGGAVLYESMDGGRRWKVVANGVAGLLAWPSTNRAFVADLAGAFLSSPRPGGPWRSRAPLGSPAAALLAVDQRTVYAALHDGTIARSTNGGGTWQVHANA